MHSCLKAVSIMLILMLAALLIPIQDEADQPNSSGKARITSWWTNKAKCQEWGIDEALREELAKGLENLQTSYQVAQTQLNEARKQQTEMMFDAKISNKELAAYNKEHVLALSDRMQAANFDARLLVRGLLNKEQMSKIAADHPQFFSTRWFRVAKVPVREGKVVIKKK